MTIIASPQNRKTLLILNNTGKNFTKGIRHGFYQLGAKNVADGRRSITKGPKTGVLVKPRGSSRSRRRSSPGEAPANMTGNLRRSMGYQIQGSDSMEFGYRDSAQYGKFLEEGTRRMQPRPNIVPTVLKNNSDATRFLSNNINKFLKK